MLRSTRDVLMAAAGFAFGVLLTKLKLHHSRDEESPTIRVRNGSIRVDIDHGTFEEVVRGGEWRVQGGRSATTQLTVRVPGQKTPVTTKPNKHYAVVTFKGPATSKVVRIEVRNGQVYAIFVGGKKSHGSHKKLEDTSAEWQMKSVEVGGHSATFPVAPCHGCAVEVEQTS